MCWCTHGGRTFIIHSFIHSFIHSNNMSSPSSSSSSSSALSQSTETTYSLALTFQVFKHGDEHQLLAFEVILTVVLAGRPHDRIAAGLAMVNNIPEALPQYFFCGGDTAWISVDETMTHTLSPDTSGAAGECAIYANGWLRSPDMVELQVSEVRTAESYSLDVIKQKFLLLIKKHLGIQQDAQVGDLSAREQDLAGREQDLVGREQAFAGREQDLAGREQDLVGREQVFEENGTEVKRLQTEISEIANKHKDITTALIKREESVSVREAKVAAGEKAIESLKTQLMERAKAISTNRKELENDVATLALNRARLNEEAASVKIAQNKLQEQMKAAAKSQKSNSSSESEDSDDDDEDDEDDEDDDDESSEDDDDEVDQTGERKRKRETNNASVKPLSKKAIKSWDNQRLQSLRVEYERICGREPGNRIRNNSTYMQKGIALAKKKAKR